MRLRSAEAVARRLPLAAAAAGRWWRLLWSPAAAEPARQAAAARHSRQVQAAVEAAAVQPRPQAPDVFPRRRGCGGVVSPGFGAGGVFISGGTRSSSVAGAPPDCSFGFALGRDLFDLLRLRRRDRVGRLVGGRLEDLDRVALDLAGLLLVAGLFDLVDDDLLVGLLLDVSDVDDVFTTTLSLLIVTLPRGCVSRRIGLKRFRSRTIRRGRSSDRKSRLGTTCQ